MAYLNETGLARFWNHILSKLSGKVDREEGKGLSTNDYTTEEKEKLASIEDGTVPIEKGGTGATDAATALANLGGAKITYGTEDLVAGESPLANGEVYLVYE